MFRGKEYVYEIYKDGSFSLAAQKLFISQPALSNSIRRIEERLGAPLFDRSTSPIQLTPVGTAYINAVEQIMGIEENFSHYLADSLNLKTGQLRLGSGALFSSYVLPPLLADFKARYPFVDISITEGSTDTLLKSIEDGTIDLFIDGEGLEEPPLEALLYLTEHIVLAVPRKWELNQELLAWQQSRENIVSGNFLAPHYPVVPLDRFQDSPFLLLPPETKSHQQISALCGQYGFAPHTILTVNQHLTAYNMTCAGMGVSFVSDMLIKNSSPDPNVVYYKLTDSFSRRNIYFYYRTNRYISNALSEFLKLVREAN